MGRALRSLAIEPEHEDPLTPRDRLLADLHEDVWRLVVQTMQDRTEPRLSDRLYIVGELCNVEHRREPARAADRLERVIEANGSCAWYSKYLGALVGLLRRYDHQRRRYVGSVLDILEAEESERSEKAGPSGPHIGGGDVDLAHPSEPTGHASPAEAF